MVEHLPGMYKALGSIKKQEKKIPMADMCRRQVLRDKLQFVRWLNR